MKYFSFHLIILSLLIVITNLTFARTVAVRFEVKIPHESLKDSSGIFLAGTFNCWDPHDSLYIMKETGPDEYSLVVPLFDGQKCEYKYTLGDWSTVEVSSTGEQIKNRKMTAQNGLIIRDTVSGWNSLKTAQKEIKSSLNKEQTDILSKLKEEIGRNLEGRIKSVADVLKKANENMLSENPDMELKKKYDDEITANLDSTVRIATDLMWKVSSMLTPGQKQEILTEMKNSDNPGILFDWISRALEAPQK